MSSFKEIKNIVNHLKVFLYFKSWLYVKVNVLLDRGKEYSLSNKVILDFNLKNVIFKLRT